MNANTNQPLTDAELQERFNLINKYGANEVDIWEMPIPGMDCIPHSNIERFRSL